ncbi:ABC transporter ATP-binding protein [Desulfogranum japonicum]|uniref:ABC transporter ATP-binding protein n=1 Tax=Desulfogranum japonicum TaxID=231447 RepID=UPI0004241EA4|nr:ABC transporter ATP-binding protein [Desulfogranum japonicum]
MEKILQKPTGILRFARPYRRTFILCVFELLLSGAANIAVYLVVADIFTKIFAHSSLTSAYISFAALLVVTFLLLKNALEYMGLNHSHIVAFNILADLRQALAQKLLKIPMGNVRKRGHGDIKKIFVDNVEEMEMLLAHMIPEGIGNFASLAVAFAVLLAVSFKMTLAVLGVVIIGMAAFMLMFMQGVKKLKAYYASSRNMNNNIIDYINGMEVIKVFNQTASSYKKYGDSVTDFKVYTADWAKSSWKYTAVYKAIMTSPLLFSLPLGLNLYMNGQLSIGALVLCVMLALSMGVPLLRLMAFAPSVAMLLEKSSHITAVLKEEELQQSSSPELPEHYDIDIANLSFAYIDNNVLEDINLSFSQNSLTALVGESGAGKSTLAMLVMRFWEYQAGEIKIGGIALKDISFDHLMQCISYVSQDNFLFQMSIEENIRLGKPNATRDEIIKAAKAACCHDFIMEAPKGYDTVVTASGATLSGGERQRITIARAIIKDAPIVILDEATSFTDPENEDKLQSALNELICGKTVIVIAHRLSTIVHADQIVVLDKGKVHTTGTHRELVETSPIYQQLWDAHNNIAGWSIAVGGEI